MELNEATVTQISGIKRWSTILPVQEQQYMLQHISNNGSQIAILKYDKSKNKYQTIICNKIHEKFGKYLQMCQLNFNKNTIVFALENGNIIKWNINVDNNNMQIIPCVPIKLQLKQNGYDIIKISEYEESLLIRLKEKSNTNRNNIWIYNESIQKWFNTQYNNEIDDAFKVYKYYNDSWYIMDISSDTSMSYELNISIHKLTVIMDDKISEMSNEDISVYTDYIFSIDLSEIKQYLTNKIHKILWDLKHKLIILLFDEFIIWISIKNDLKEPLYVLSLIPQQNIKFRDMIFMFNGMIIAVITNHGSILFYQRLAEKPIYINYNENNTNQNVLNIDWKKLSKIHGNNSFKLYSRNDSKLLLNNGHIIIEYTIHNFKLKYFASNALAFIRNVDWIQQQLNENKINDEELLYIRNIIAFDMKQVLQKDEKNICFMNSFLWFIECENIITKYVNIWELIFIDMLKNKQSLLKHENMLKIIKICNNHFDWISKCLDIEINLFYEEIECIIHTNGINILTFNWRDVFDDNIDNNSNLCNKLYSNIILLMFEDRSKIITNRKIDNLIDILWCISKLNCMYTKCKQSQNKWNILPLNSIENNQLSQTQKLKKWLQLQFDEMMNNINNNFDNSYINKEQFAYIFWKKISEYQHNLISNNKIKNDNIICNLVSIFSSNINNSQTHKLNRQIIKIPIVSIYCNGKRNEYYDSELEFEEIEIIKQNNPHEIVHKTQKVSPEKLKSPSPLPAVNIDVETNASLYSNTTPQTIKETVISDIKSIVSSCNGNENNNVSTNVIANDFDTMNTEMTVQRDNIEIDSSEHKDNLSEIGNGEHIDVEMKVNEEKQINLEDIAKYVPEKYIIDRLANKLTKQELIQLFATKMQLKENNKYKNEYINQPTKKWKLIEYDINDKIIENKQLSSKIKKKIKKYLRKKNKLIEIQKKKHIASNNKIYNAECNNNNNNNNNEEHKQIEIKNEIKKEIINDNLTTTITNDISFIVNDNIINENNKYELSMDTFDCIHIAPYKTTHTQTKPSDIIINTKYIPPKNTRKENSNWFIAPLLNVSETKTCSNVKCIEITHIKNDKTFKQNKVMSTQNESEIKKKESESENAKFVPVPVIGARTAGLSYIDPSMKINTDNLTVQFPSINNFEEQLNEIEESKELERDGKNSLLQSQCSLMLHSMATTTINDMVFDKHKLNTNVNDFQHDIAVMDAQIANLSAMCNNIQNNYYKMNSTLDNNEEIYQNVQTQTQSGSNSNQQIGTMEAWSLLQSIQENLNCIDNEINIINNNETRKQQLKNIKAKSKKPKKKCKTPRQLTTNLTQQTDLLNEIYNKL